MNDLQQRYGASWELVQAYIKAIPTGFLFDSLGHPDSQDESVSRIRDWDVFQKAVDYSFEGVTFDNCPYLQFLRTCARVRDRYEALAIDHTVIEHLENAATEAGHTYADEVSGNQDDGYYALINSREREYYWAASVQHHCSYIAIEMVVAHLTDIHLMRDMWYWYRAGHWPCGWEGDWPEGRLIVF